MDFSENFEQLPFDIEAEQSVLGAILADASCLPTVLEYLTIDCFYKDQHRQLFSIMLSMFSAGETIDFITILAKVRAEHIFESDEQAKIYLTQLVQIVPIVSNVDKYAQIVREKYYIRRLVLVSGNIKKEAAEGTDAKDMLDHAEQSIYEIRQGKDTTGLVHIKDVIVGAYDDLQRVAQESRDGILGIPSGFSELDRTISGLNKSDLIILAARPAVGKTSLALNIASNVGLRSEKSVAVFSLEMSREQLVLRMLSSLGQIPSKQLRVGQLDENQWADLAEASGRLSGAKIYLDDTSSVNIADIRSKLRRIPDLGLVIIDYLQLMSSAKRIENRVQEVSDITRNLKILAKDLNVPVVVLSQLSRNSEKSATKRPMLSDLRESGSIEQDADIVLMLYKENEQPEGEDTQGAQSSASAIINCDIAKNRHGETRTIQFHWDGQFTRFSTLGYMTND